MQSLNQFIDSLVSLLIKLVPNNMVEDPTIAFRFLVIFGMSFIFLFIFKKIVLIKLLSFAQKTKTTLDDFILDVIQIWNWFVLVLASLYFASYSLPLSNEISYGITTAMTLVISWYVVQTILAVVKYGFSRYISKKQRYEENFDPTVLMFMKQVSAIVIWVAAALVIAQNLGFEVTTILGGLGIGGFAVAFAVQNLLSDVFSSISIYFDKPFKIGDFIVVGQDSGVVKKIGIQSTRIQTLQGQELIISNKELTESRVNNYKRMQTRRVVFTVGVEYGTPIKKLKEIPSIIKEIIEKEPDAEFDRSHLNVLGDFSLNFETVYRITSSEYTVYMDTQQKIYLELLAAFEKEKIEIAFPTQKTITSISQ